MVAYPEDAASPPVAIILTLPRVAETRCEVLRYGTRPDGTINGPPSGAQGSFLNSPSVTSSGLAW
jgi:hypothetical protein